MKTWLALFAFLGLLTGCATTTLENAPAASGQAAAGTHFEPGEGVVIATALELTATVVSVDKGDRSIVVKDGKGEAQTIELTEDVKNFDQIRPGDEILVEVYSALAMQLAKNRKPVEGGATTMVGVAQPGERPKIVVVDVVEVLAKVSHIDRKERRVTVTGPLGKSVKLQVPEDVEGFDALKVGDEVNARYAEKFAISVQKTR
ncbi:MAG: hypothetical protein JRH16_19955 [Deltaproteobacteria bacterium]|nr:hypothetical protein [Deltaproteobacteria bacterium]MBW2420053.1 hypothetical protein [Deltaproteobacteria bacterium]